MRTGSMLSVLGCRFSVRGLFTLLLLAAGTARADKFVAVGGTGNGSSWGSPTNSIQGAIDAAGAGETILVSNGTYTISAQILITNAITVQSFGNGVTGGLGNASNTIVQASGTTRVFSNGNANAVIAGLTIRNGSGRGDNGWSGLGVRMSGGLVRDCIIRENGIAGDISHLQGSGIFMTGGTVSNCMFLANKTGGGGSDGGGIYASAGRILSCRILGNTCGGGNGGGIYASSASVLIRNCLIATNSCPGNGGGVYGGTVESCTVVSNNAAGGGSSGGGVYGSTVTNSIVLKNRTGSGILSVANYDSTATFSYSCATPKPSGVGNVADAAFVNFGAGDYRLSACQAVDSGTNLAWMTGALDLGGNPRTNGVNNRVDMGAYELVPGALQCGLAADVTSVTAPSNVVFISYVAGTNANVTSYTWDFGDGNTANGATLAVVTNLYTAVGLYTVKLTVANASESFTATNAGYITVWGANAYVWTNSPSPGAPYHTWANAAHAIGDAVDAVPAGTTVIVTNGTYNINVQIRVDKAITVRSFGNGVYGGLANASNTIIDAGDGSIRGMLISNSMASVDGFTIQRGEQPAKTTLMDYSGAGVWLYGGVLQNCIVQDNNRQAPSRNNNYTQGGGIYLTGGGTVSNCVIRRNIGYGPSAWGGGVYMNSGVLTHCQVYNNTNYANGSASGAGVYMTGGTTRNCLMYGNSSISGGGAYVGGGVLESCTIVTNSASTDGGGVYFAGGTVSNSIVYFNTVGGMHSNLNTTAGLYYSCSVNPGTTANGCITDNPSFENPAAGDYRPRAKAPRSLCIDAGMNQAWMIGAKDLAGSDRILKGTKPGLVVDIGCYETYVAPAGTVLSLR